MNMRDKKITIDYAAGVLENIGGFYVFNNKKRKAVQPKFKIVCARDEKADVIDEVLIFLKGHGIQLTVSDERENLIAYTTTRYDMLERLIDFLDANCKIKKKNQDFVKEILQDRKKLLSEINDKKVRIYNKILINQNGNKNGINGCEVSKNV